MEIHQSLLTLQAGGCNPSDCAEESVWKVTFVAQSTTKSFQARSDRRTPVEISSSV